MQSPGRSSTAVRRNATAHAAVDASWNVMANVQKPDFVFRRNGRVQLNRRGRQFSPLLAAQAWASAVVMLDTPCSEVVWRVLATHPFASFPFTSPPVRHRVPSHFSWSLSSGNMSRSWQHWMEVRYKRFAPYVLQSPLSLQSSTKDWL